jgi:hypothetical protein
MEKHHNGNDLAIAHLTFSIASFYRIISLNGVFIENLGHFLAKIINGTENFGNFVRGNHKRYIS